MLEISGLCVSYGPVEALRGVDLLVGEGEAVALLGPNGAGKTSLLRAVSGLVAKAGVVRFDGDDVTGLAPDALGRRGLVHVPEGRRIFAPLTVHENLLVGTSARGRRASRFGVDDVYDLFPQLGPLRSRAGWALSGGEQQMVAVGRALVAAPKLLMLDEPSLGLAPRIAQVVYQALRTISGVVPLLVVEQNTAAALGLCQRGYVFVAGEIRLAGTATELSDRQQLLDSYLSSRVPELDA